MDLESINNMIKDNMYYKCYYRLFNQLDNVSKEIIISAMFSKEYTNGQTIITQGEDGNNYYLLDKGECEVYVDRDNKQVLAKTCEPGDSFGELALLYNAPRAATVIAKGNVRVWCVDRTTFRV